MSDLELIDAAAQKTGEDSHEIRRRGFMLTGPEDSSSDLDLECMLDLIDLPEAGFIDWDALGYGCRAPFFDASKNSRKKALKPGGWRACSLRPQFIRLIKRAGLKPWPRPFHNLRASRETELMHQHAIHVVTAWLGNSPQIAMKHYCMVTDEDFKKARQGHPNLAPTRGRESGANSDARPDGDVAQNPAQQPHATPRTCSHDSRANPSQDATSATPREDLRDPAESQNGGHGIRTRNRFLGI